MGSIRRYLLIVLLATVTLFNFVAAVQGYRSSMSQAEQLLDRQLEALAQVLLVTTGEPAEFQKQPGQEELIFQVWDQQGKLLHRSDNAPETAMAEESGFSVANMLGFRWRIYCMEEPSNGLRVMVAERDDLRFQLAEELVLSSVLPIVLVLPLLGFLIWWIVGRGLRPLEKLATRLANKKPEDLGKLPTGEEPEELTQVVDSTNALLDRLNTYFAREQRFTSDAAHELRTPLSALKVNAYNLAAQVPDNDPNVERLNSSIDRMTHLIEQLLDLYRTNPDKLSGSFLPVDLKLLAREVITENYDLFADRQQEIELCGDAAMVNGDRFAITLLLKNLLVNAAKYTPEGGKIIVDIKGGESVQLICEDSGPGIPEEQYERVFERFYRVGGDRHQSNVQGSGLGLSIVRHIVELHGGEITLGQSQSLGGLKVTISFPAEGETK